MRDMKSTPASLSRPLSVNKHGHVFVPPARRGPDWLISCGSTTTENLPWNMNRTPLSFWLSIWDSAPESSPVDCSVNRDFDSVITRYKTPPKFEFHKTCANCDFDCILFVFHYIWRNLWPELGRQFFLGCGSCFSEFIEKFWLLGNWSTENCSREYMFHAWPAWVIETLVNRSALRWRIPRSQIRACHVVPWLVSSFNLEAQLWIKLPNVELRLVSLAGNVRQQNCHQSMMFGFWN